MKDIIIFGINSLAKELCYFLEEEGYKVAAYTIDGSYIKEPEYNGRPLIPYEDLKKNFDQSQVAMLVMIGYSRMNEKRKEILERCMSDGWQLPSYIHSRNLNLTASVGYGNIVFPSVEIGMGTVLGNGNILGRHTIIGHDVTIGDYNYFTGSVHVCGYSKIGNNNFIGVNSTIVDNGCLGGHNLIGAGVCIEGKLEDYQLVAPGPVRKRTMSPRAMDLMLMRTIENANM